MLRYRKLEEMTDRATDIIGTFLFHVIVLLAVASFLAITGYISYRAIIGHPVSVAIQINGFQGDWHQVSKTETFTLTDLQP